MSDLKNRFPTIALTALRVVAGLAFASHGAQKTLGWFGGFGPDHGKAVLMSQFGVAGIIELVGGLLIAIGLFTRPTALIASGQMAVAYFMVHAAGGKIFWWENGGELAMIFSFIFLYFAAHGAGPHSVDGMRRRGAS